MANSPDTENKNSSAGVKDKLNRLRSEINDHPILYAVVAVTLFIGGYFAEKGLNELLWTDPAAAKVEALESQIDEKTKTISETLESMDASLSKMDTDKDEARKFLQSAQKLRADLRSLRPDLEAFSKEARQLSARILVEKREEIASSGQSHIPDFTLRLDSATTLCEQGFTAGYDDYDETGDGHIYVSHRGADEDDWLNAGESIRLESGDAAVSVYFLGHEQDGQIARMNFDCENVKP